MVSLLVLSMAAVAANSPAPIEQLEPGHVYTLEELTRIGLINQPRLKAAAAAEQAARERKGEAQAPNYPTVNAYAEYVRATYNNSIATFLSVPDMPREGGHPAPDRTLINANPGLPISATSNDNYMLGVMADYDVVDFGRTRSDIHIAEAQIDLAHSDAEVAAEAVVFSVRTSYFGLLAAQALLTTAQKTLAEAKEHFDWAHEAVKDGLRAPVDELQAKADVTKAQLALVRAQAGVRVARVRILQAIGIEKGQGIEVAAAAPVSETVETEDALLQRAFGQRPDLASRLAAQHAAEARVSRFKAEFLPQLDAVAGVDAMGADPEWPNNLSFVPNWDVGLVLSIPIFEGFLTVHQVREAEALVEVQRQNVEDLKLTVIEQVREAFVNFKSALEAVVAADANQAAAEEELHVISGRYNNGLGSILDLIIAQATAVTAEDQAVRARYQSGVARSMLDLAIGEPPPPASSAP
ncbi:MAG: TolC family protein [Myxococcales bacterium]